MMKSDRELLEEVFTFLVNRSYIQGDEASVRDMVQRYKQPPLTLYHLVCMQMTKQDYDKLDNLLERIVAHFDPNTLPLEVEPLSAIPEEFAELSAEQVNNIASVFGIGNKSHDPV